MSVADRGAYADAIRGHYSQADLTESIFQALEIWGVDPSTLRPGDLASLDEFHIGGRAATLELAELARVAPESRILDIGCGVGGPARTLAAEFGSRVVGIDIVPEYVAAARAITESVRLTENVSFRVGDTRSLPCGDGQFDVVWTQHTLVNAPDKAQVLSEARRVLAPGGRLALHEVVAGDGGPPILPLPWASDLSISFLVEAALLREIVAGESLAELHYVDTSTQSLAWFRRERSAAKADRMSGAAPRPSLRLLMGPDAAEKSKNMIRNLEERRIGVVMLVAERAESIDSPRAK